MSDKSCPRFLCRDCGFRFFNNPYKECQTNVNHQLCVNKKAKKLDNATKTNIVAVDVKNTQKGQIIHFFFHLKKQGYAEATIKLRCSVLKVLMDRGANLSDPETVKDVISTQSWSQNRKRNVIASYTKFLNYQGLTWNPPKCKVIRKLPFVPNEKEIDDLVAGCSRTVAVFLQLLKETGMRSGEAIAISWIDVDFQKRAITCNMPEKGGNARVITNLSGKLLAMTKRLPQGNKRVFGFTTKNSLKAMFTRERKRLAYKLQNSRLLEIHFH